MMCLCYVCRIFTISLLLLVPIKANDNERKEIDANARHRRASILDFMGSQSATPCVADAKGLVSAINSLPSAGSKTNLIRLCSERIKLSSELGAMGEGIDISDKKIELRCFLPSPKRCILDAEGVSRIFYGSKTSFYAVKVDFMNAGNYEDSKYGSGGGALQFVGGSKVSLRDCTFSACSADTGGAIQMVDSALTLKGPTIFKRNKASILGGAVHLDGSNLTAIEGHVDYLENEASFAGGALYCYNSVSKLKRNSFSGNIVAGDEVSLEILLRLVNCVKVLSEFIDLTIYSLYVVCLNLYVKRTEMLRARPSILSAQACLSSSLPSLKIRIG